MFSFSVSSLYFIFQLATQIATTAIPSQPSSLTLQVESSNNVPGPDGLEYWTDDPPNPLQSDDLSSQAHSGPLSSPTEGHNWMFAEDPAPHPPQVYNGLSPIPAPISFLNIFQNFLGRTGFIGYPIFPSYQHHHINKPIDCTQYTIGEVLNWTLHHTSKPSPHGRHDPPPLHRLAWLVNLSHPVQELLFNPKADLTLFAPDDEALTPPSKRRHHSQESSFVGSPTEASALDAASHSESTHIFWDAVEAIETYNDCPHHLPLSNIWTKVPDGDKEKKKKFFLHAIEMVLKYHVSPGSKNVLEILDSSTLPTELPVLPSAESAKFRVRVGSSLPHLAKPGQISLNFFTKLDLIKYSPILTKNGVIYIAKNAPLLPPLSPLSELFLFPKPFSTLTSALQKVHLDDALLPRWQNKTIPLSNFSELPDEGGRFDQTANFVDERVQSILSSLVDGHDGKLEKPTFTVFAPTNHAFRALGPAANAFLFSPFGAHVLRYVLSYHIVPYLIWNTDHCDEIKHGKTSACDLESQTIPTAEFPLTQSFGPAHGLSPAQIHPPAHRPGKVNVTELSLGTLLGPSKNNSLAISLVEFKHLGKGPTIRRVYIKQNSQKLLESPNEHAIPVLVADGAAWGGAIHLIPQLIRPPVPEGHHRRDDVQRAIELSILS